MRSIFFHGFLPSFFELLFNLMVNRKEPKFFGYCFVIFLFPVVLRLTQKFSCSSVVAMVLTIFCFHRLFLCRSLGTRTMPLHCR
jgi:hypothetical protein